MKKALYENHIHWYIRVYTLVKAEIKREDHGI